MDIIDTNKNNTCTKKHKERMQSWCVVLPDRFYYWPIRREISVEFYRSESGGGLERRRLI